MKRKGPQWLPPAKIARRRRKVEEMNDAKAFQKVAHSPEDKFWLDADEVDGLDDDTIDKHSSAEAVRNSARGRAKVKEERALRTLMRAQEAIGDIIDYKFEKVVAWIDGAGDTQEQRLHAWAQVSSGVDMALEDIGDDMLKVKMVLKKVAGNIRDVIMLIAQSMCVNPKDREQVLQFALEAYAEKPMNEARAKLLLAYQKDKTNLRCAFTQNNQVAANRRGGPRKPRGYRKMCEEAEAAKALNTLKAVEAEGKAEPVKNVHLSSHSDGVMVTPTTSNLPPTVYTISGSDWSAAAAEAGVPLQPMFDSSPMIFDIRNAARILLCHELRHHRLLHMMDVDDECMC